MSNGKKKIVNVKRNKKIIRRRSGGGLDQRQVEKPEVLERRKNAMELRASGLTYEDIAQQLGYHDRSHAKRDVDKGIDAVIMDSAKQVVAMDIAMMDEFKMRCLHALRTNGDLSQIDRILRVTDYKYRLLGISDETVRQLQSEHGITVNVGGSKTNVMVVQAAAETEEEFLAKMMNAVGVDPNSPAAKKWKQENIDYGDRTLPMLQGGANSDKDAILGAAEIDDEEIVDAEIVE